MHGYRLPKKRSSSAGTQVLKAPMVPLDESLTQASAAPATRRIHKTANNDQTNA
jgi:hypothetical protein